MTLLFARPDLYLKNRSICTSRVCMRINYLFVCLSVGLSVCLSTSPLVFEGICRVLAFSISCIQLENLLKQSNVSACLICPSASFLL